MNDNMTGFQKHLEIFIGIYDKLVSNGLIQITISSTFTQQFIISMTDNECNNNGILREILIFYCSRFLLI
jgi:hypothetical protein